MPVRKARTAERPECQARRDLRRKGKRVKHTASIGRNAEASTGKEDEDVIIACALDDAA